MVLVQGFCPLVTPTSDGFRLNFTKPPKLKTESSDKDSRVEIKIENSQEIKTESMRGVCVRWHDF